MATVQDLAFREYGEGLPVLVIHGWTISGAVEAQDLEPIFTKQTSQYRRIYIDLPGMGQTPIGQAKDLDSMLASVEAFIEKHILPSKFLITGSSCGAYFTRALAYKYENHVEGLLLRVPLVEPLNEKRDLDPFVPAIADEKLLASLPTAERQQLGDIAVQTPEYVDAFKKRLMEDVLPAVEASDSTALDIIRDDPDKYRLTTPLHNEKATLNKPTLIVTGRQDGVTGYRDAWSLLKCYPRASFVVLDRADHGLPVDESDRHIFEALVLDWLRRVEETRRITAATE
ncbi:Pimeloyl-[acyl-carrier protein] methyl ester esterase [Pseudocercospora fuligena]|uniref:Pimeloyl-[acyl-carrier protein] methyl ester esterase n=1 Tax=Pseudocercospora fuligena TaxID=685502 RepID=A0A8H6RL57_9PEZI|nr:Pimeloyl-[acyl-carrier protein] methyl ester esterase [Pseudocercospora fuligena]